MSITRRTISEKRWRRPFLHPFNSNSTSPPIGKISSAGIHLNGNVPLSLCSKVNWSSFISWVGKSNGGNKENSPKHLRNRAGIPSETHKRRRRLRTSKHPCSWRRLWLKLFRRNFDCNQKFKTNPLIKKRKKNTFSSSFTTGASLYFCHSASALPFCWSTEENNRGNVHLFQQKIYWK